MPDGLKIQASAIIGKFIVMIPACGYQGHDSYGKMVWRCRDNAGRMAENQEILTGLGYYVRDPVDLGWLEFDEASDVRRREAKGTKKRAFLLCTTGLPPSGVASRVVGEGLSHPPGELEQQDFKWYVPKDNLVEWAEPSIKMVLLLLTLNDGKFTERKVYSLFISGWGNSRLWYLPQQIV